jgi:uncharacterized C2H2 Zn-finger protein
MLRRHRQLHEAEALLHTCPRDDCNHVSRTARDLQRHLKGPHEGIKNFQCPYCWNEFTRMDNTQRHIVKQHQDNDCIPFNKIHSHGCMHCRETFPTEIEYDVHQCWNNYSPAGPPLDMKERYMCVYCFEKFPCDRMCLQHMLKHVQHMPGHAVYDRFLSTN